LLLAIQAEILAGVQREGERRNVRWGLRSLAIGGAVGFAAGLVVGGTLGRVFMRILFLARKDTLGLETAMGAIIGDFTAGGTFVICVFGAVFGLGLGLAYVVLRALLPSRGPWRQSVFVLASSGLMLGVVIFANREDFAVLPVTLSLLLIVGSVALTALPVPVLVERFAPDRDRSPGRRAHAAVGLGMAGITVFAALAVASAYAV
jgi:hypothetical protein